MKKNIIKTIGLCGILAISAGCASAPKPVKVAPPVIKLEYKADYNDDYFTITRTTDSIHFRCDINECSLLLPEKRLTNKDYRNEKKPIVDEINGTLTSCNTRYNINFQEDEIIKKKCTKQFQKADKVYKKFEKEFKVKEHFKKWLNRPDPLDKYLK